VERKGILIVGGGLVGQTLAAKLAADGQDVTLVERDPIKVNELQDLLDVQVIEGNGSTARVLRQAGIESCSLVVASTDRDEVNVVVGLLAAELFHVPRVVVRVRDVDHEEGFRIAGRQHSLDYALVNPEAAAVERIATLLQVPGALDVSAFLGGDVLVAGFRIASSSDFAGLRVSDMSLLFADAATLAVAIHRGPKWTIPDGSDVIEAGDLVYFSISRHDLGDVLALVGVVEDDRSRIIIGGASSIGLALAKRLMERGQRVVVIEDEHDRSKLAADELIPSLVIAGKVTDQGLLEENQIENVSTFVAVTEDHETNLVACLLAKRLGAGRTLALVDNPALVAMVSDIGIDAIISQRLLTIGLTMQHIRGAGVRSGAALLEDEVEIMEVEAVRGCRLTSGPLMEVKLPKGVLVAAVKRGDKLAIPGGRDTVEAGDHVLLITTSDLASKLTEYLEA
jgi:trk system potassium uptake protein TrkA